jgi:predicted peptidase
MDYKLLISIIALLISLVSLGWNIYNKIKSEKKKLLIQSYKVKSKDTSRCVVTLTNVGNKPIFIRRIELEEKVAGNSIKRHLDFNKYREEFENKPINPEHFKNLIFKDTKHFGFYDEETKKFKKTRLTVVDPKGKRFVTKWFGQNNLR